MLQYEKIDVSEGIDSNKAIASRKCMTCNYWCFKDVGCNCMSLINVTMY